MQHAVRNARECTEEPGFTLSNALRTRCVGVVYLCRYESVCSLKTWTVPVGSVLPGSVASRCGWEQRQRAGAQYRGISGHIKQAQCAHCNEVDMLLVYVNSYIQDYTVIC